MRTSKSGKRMKKRGRELVDNDKSKKLCSKKKHTLASNEENSVVNNGEEPGEEPEPVAADHSRGKKAKSNKGLKRRKDNVVSASQSAVVSNGDEIEPVIQDFSDGKKDKSKRARKNRKKDTLLSNKQNTVNNDEEEILPDDKILSNKKKGKSKKTRKQGKDVDSTISESTVQDNDEVATGDVYQISSGEDDDSKGMKKWIKEYHERRPGLKVLQERIDEFITAYDEHEEQAKREREAQLADDGWTVVVHRKGGKKTTDSESGVAVGSVAEAAVREKMAKKKSKDVGLDFYRFQRKEAHRSEIMKLQSKFEEDKKRIQQIRAARKFRPY